MYKYRLVIAYDGTNWSGWQRLADTQRTIQGQLERVLNVLLNNSGEEQTIRINGAGRTDAGVHALGQVADFQVGRRIDPDTLQRQMNQSLPEDIRIRQCREAGARFHSRYDARRKVYCYTLDTRMVPDVFWRRYACHVPVKLNMEQMKAVAARLEGRHDFRNFTTLKDTSKQMVRDIDRIDPVRDRHLLYIVYEGNGFLQQMVRILSGVMVAAGTGEIAPEQVERLLDAEERHLAAAPLPAKGLRLMEVKYQ